MPSRGTCRITGFRSLWIGCRQARSQGFTQSRETGQSEPHWDLGLHVCRPPARGFCGTAGEATGASLRQGSCQPSATDICVPRARVLPLQPLHSAHAGPCCISSLPPLLFTGAVKPLTFNIITYVTGFKSTVLLFVFHLPHLIFVTFFSFPAYFWIIF